MNKVYMIGAKRTAVIPRGGAFSAIEVKDLGAVVLNALLADAGMDTEKVDLVVMGNALYGGGNPARVIGLQAGLPDGIPALTIDTQCCSGLDSIGLGYEKIKSGKSHVVLAGGAESYSRSPLRMRRPRTREEEPLPYDRPPFTPWADRDPDMLEASAKEAEIKGISSEMQIAWAVESHAKAMKARDCLASEIVPINEVMQDAFSRHLSQKVSQRLQPIVGDKLTGLNAATVSVEADAAAAVLLVSQRMIQNISPQGTVLEIVDYKMTGASPMVPMNAMALTVNELLKANQLDPDKVAVAELMEAFAVQMIEFKKAVNMKGDRINRGGGALARGHPIGASGAVNMVRLWHEMQKEAAGTYGIAAIAAAGGLGASMLVKSV
ncbi:thiolase family protein [Sneathiella aquimaris]|uniref:thiolase family protein n=1 Tax=Sneathiella aquimaris TaxID=2599305 RepID=UPI00146E6B0E|nr:thiolase family protein [Sneathiella aquimaris]